MSTPYDTQVILRPLGLSDIDDLYALSEETGPGFTSLPHNRFHLESKLSRSELSFQEKKQTEPGFFLFGLFSSEAEDQGLLGVCGLKASAGNHLPFYHFKHHQIVQYCRSLDKWFQHGLLTLVNDHQSAGELCSLFLRPQARRGYRGAFLSKARFAFIAQHRARFPHHFIAEMRGVSDESGVSPFWESAMRPFFEMDFTEADFLSTAHHKQFIADLIPRYPIYTRFLSPAAQSVIGMVHPLTKPAWTFLQQERFTYQGCVDIFDAGPTLEAPTDHIYSIEHSRVYRVKQCLPATRLADASEALLANVQPGAQFKATIGRIRCHTDALDCDISTDTAKRLAIQAGDDIRVNPFHPSN